jgi:hypothetical protein
MGIYSSMSGFSILFSRLEKGSLIMNFKNRTILSLVLGLVILAVSSCGLLVSGKVYMAYYWDVEDTKLSMSDNNTWMPQIITNNQYYEVREGTYFGQYTITNPDIVTWGYTYTLWADQTFGIIDPIDTFFQLWFSEVGPKFYDLTFSKDLSSQKSESRTIKNLSPGSQAASVGDVHVIEQTKNGYTLRLEYWKIE